MKFGVFVLMLLSTASLLAQVSDEPLYLDITFPAPSDTVNADKARISGNTLPDAILRINNKRIDLFAQGSFATRIDLLEGMNQVIVVAQKGDELVQDILFIYRPPVLISFPPEPTEIDAGLLEPAQDVWLMNGDYLRVKIKGSPSGQATFDVDRLGKNFPMAELAAEQANGLRGVYGGVLKVTGQTDSRPMAIEFELNGVDGKKKRQTAPGKLFVLSEQIPLVGMTLISTNIHAALEGFTPMARIPDSVRLHIIGREAERFKIALNHKVGYVEALDVKMLSVGTPLPQATIGAPRIDQDEDWVYFTMPISERLPFEVSAETSPLRLKLTVWGARQASHWITYPNTAIDVVDLRLSQPDEAIFQLYTQINQDKSWGHKVYYADGSMILAVRRQPQISTPGYIDNLIFALDPGHGGDETGATSPLGVLEKNINLAWAEKLAALLRRQGAAVMLTRNGDETVSLAERVRRAEAANANFFISLHNNATTPHGNPLSAQGTSVYFTLPQNKELVWSIYPHMVKLGLAPYGRVYNSYYVTNSTGFLVALVEGGFLTNPYEELKLADEAFIDKMAQAVYDGIVDFLRLQTQ